MYFLIRIASSTEQRLGTIKRKPELGHDCGGYLFDYNMVANFLEKEGFLKVKDFVYSAIQQKTSLCTKL